MAEPIDPIEELLGAYALDAVDDDERRRVEEYIAVHPHARDEVQAHREVAAMLSLTGAPAPEGVWERIADVLDDRAPAPGPELARVLPMRQTARWRTIALGAAAAVVVAVGAVVVTLAVSDDAPTGDSGNAIAEAYGEAWSDPDARRAQLTSEVDEALVADAVLEPSGLGFLSARSLPELPADETYQLWGVFADGDVISLGVIGNRPGIEPFTARGDIDAVVITREQAGGVVSSTSGALLVGELN